MDEGEIESAGDAAFYLANEVVHEYHAMPVVQRADFGGPNKVYMLLNEKWFEFTALTVTDEKLIEDLERLVN